MQLIIYVEHILSVWDFFLHLKGDKCVNNALIFTPHFPVRQYFVLLLNSWDLFQLYRIWLLNRICSMSDKILTSTSHTVTKQTQPQGVCMCVWELVCVHVLYLWPVEAMTISSPAFHVTAIISVSVTEPLVAVWAKCVQGTGTGIPGETGDQQWLTPEEGRWGVSNNNISAGHITRITPSAYHYVT